MKYEPRNEDMPREVPPLYDEQIREKLSKLSLEELIEISEKSGTTTNSGYLNANPDDADRDDYIQEISEVGDKAQWQIDTIKQYLGIGEG